MASREIGFYRAKSFGRAILSCVHLWDGDLELAPATSAMSTELLARQAAELSDAITIDGACASLSFAFGRNNEADRIVLEIESRLDRAHSLLENEELRNDRRTYPEHLLETVLSFEGPALHRERD